MKLRTRKKYWNRCWFDLRLRGHDFHSFNMDDIRHLKKRVSIYDVYLGSWLS